MGSVAALEVSHYMPVTHGTHGDFIAPWARALERRSSGAISVTIHDGSTALGLLANQYEQVRRGAVDVAHCVGSLPPHRFPRLSIAGMPFLADSAASGTNLLWHLLPRHLAPEFAEFKVLALHADAGGLLHTKDRPIERLEDLAGLRIRTPNPLISAMIERLGAVPVPLAPPEINAALRNGIIDAAAMPWDVVLYTRTEELLRCHLDTRLYVSPLYFVMNRARYERLAPELQAAIDDVSGAALVGRFGAWWERWEAAGVSAVIARGHTMTRLSEAERARWRAAVEPAIGAHLDGLSCEGIDARAIYEAAQRYLAAGGPSMDATTALR
jgi:TRAP-type C4-dicarboxylate transport system substrate-binding protein